MPTADFTEEQEALMVSLFQMLEPACGDMDEQAYDACLDRLLHVLRGNPRRLHEAFEEFLTQELAARVERERVRASHDSPKELNHGDLT